MKFGNKLLLRRNANILGLISDQIATPAVPSNAGPTNRPDRLLSTSLKLWSVRTVAEFPVDLRTLVFYLYLCCDPRVKFFSSMTFC